VQSVSRASSSGLVQRVSFTMARTRPSRVTVARNTATSCVPEQPGARDQHSAARRPNRHDTHDVRRIDSRSSPIDIRHRRRTRRPRHVIDRAPSTRVIVSVVLIVLFRRRRGWSGSVGRRAPPYKNDDNESNERSSVSDSLIASGFCRHTRRLKDVRASPPPLGPARSRPTA